MPHHRAPPHAFGAVAWLKECLEACGFEWVAEVREVEAELDGQRLMRTTVAASTHQRLEIERSGSAGWSVRARPAAGAQASPAHFAQPPWRVRLDPNWRPAACLRAA